MGADGEEPVLVAATPQSLPVADGGLWPRLVMVALGAVMVLVAVLPPLVGRRARRGLPVPAPGGAGS
ncbi:hypothetical protein GCM10010413_22450 [Promicromonospora sukumoe]